MSISLLDVFDLQVGRFHEPEKNGGRRFTTLGWGLDLYYVRVDHAWISSARDNDVLPGTIFWRLTARLPLEESAENIWKQISRR